jgi:hypothetical protein
MAISFFPTVTDIQPRVLTPQEVTLKNWGRCFRQFQYRLVPILFFCLLHHFVPESHAALTPSYLLQTNPNFGNEWSCALKTMFVETLYVANVSFFNNIQELLIDLPLSWGIDINPAAVIFEDQPIHFG